MNEFESQPQPFPSQPISLQRGDDGSITIRWDDGSEGRWSAAELRKTCPCATCREKKRKATDEPAAMKPLTLPVISAAEARPLRVESMQPVGNYAYNIAFSDGHNSGIYPFELLRKSVTS